MEQNSDNSVIQRARQGDQGAISRLYESTKNYAYFVARRYLKNDEDVADILQDAYISAFSKLDTFEDGRPFKPWLRAIVVNKCLDLIRSKKAIYVSENEIGEIASDNEEIIPAAWLERAEKRRDIMRIIDGLPDGQHMAVTLFYFEGLTISEMSGAMGVVEGTVKAHLHHGRKAIKEEVMLEEKKGNKLYGIVLIPLLTQLYELEAEAAVIPEKLSKVIWQRTINGLIANGVIAGASAAAGAAVKGVGAAAKFAALSAGAKAGIIAAAVAVAVAAVAVPVYISRHDTPQEPPAVQITDRRAAASDIDSDITTPDDPADVENESELLEPVEADFAKDSPYKVDLDGDGIEDTVTVEKGGTADTLIISSSRYGEYSTLFDYTFEPDGVKLLAIDTGNNNYSLCVTMNTGGNGGAGSIDGLILYGTSEGWKRITSLLSVGYVFTGEILGDQVFGIQGETGYSARLITSSTFVQKGSKIATDSRISAVSYVLNEESGGYDFVVRQYLYSEFVANGIGYGYTQVSIDADTKTLIPVKQWAVSFDDNSTDDGNVAGQSEPVGADISGVDMRETARAYREVLEANESSVLKICIKNICGDSIPELLYIDMKTTEIAELHIWTYDGKAKEILSETVIDRSGSFEHAPKYYGVMTANDGNLYIMLRSDGSGWMYEIYFCYTFNDELQKYTEYDLTSSSVIKHIKGFDIFDGYSTEGWDNEAKFFEQRETLHSNAEYIIFTNFWDESELTSGLRIYYYESAMDYLDELER